MDENIIYRMTDEDLIKYVKSAPRVFSPNVTVNPRISDFFKLPDGLWDFETLDRVYIKLKSKGYGVSDSQIIFFF